MAITVTDVLATLRQSVYGPSFDVGATSGAVAYRVPFLFTSRKRLGSLVPNISDIVGQVASPVVPSMSALPTVIKMAINPETITWKQPKRIVRKDTMEGAVFFHFNNSMGQDNDIITMDMRGTTGNINLVTNPNVIDKGINPYLEENKAKLLTWHNLYNLTREAKLYQDSTGAWNENEFYIVYTTKLFPMGIRLAGFFTKVLDFEEHANDPNKRHYSMSFTVTDTSPLLDDIATALRDYLVASSATASVQRTNSGG